MNLRAGSSSHHGASVVIPTYNRARLLEKTIPILLRDIEIYELIVVDDGSTDETASVVTGFSKSDDRVVFVSQRNGGEARARQSGLEAATRDVVVFLDDDVVPRPGLVRGHLSHHLINSRTVVLGYMPVAMEGLVGEELAVARIYARDYEDTCKVYEREPHHILDYFWAGNFSIPRVEALNVGFVRSPTLSYHEDLRFGLGCEASGLTAVFDRSLRADHHYRKNIARFIAECSSSGESRAILVTEFPSSSPIIDPTAHATAICRVARNLFIANRRSPITGRMLVWLLKTCGGDNSRLFTVFLLRALRQIVLQRRFSEMRRSTKRSLES